MDGKASRRIKKLLMASAWSEFKGQFRDDEDALEEILKTTYGYTVSCPKCASTNISRRNAKRKLSCRACHHTWRVTVGTFFEGIRRPLAWLGAIWLRERVPGVNPFEAHTLIGVGYATAWEMFRKLDEVIRKKLEASDYEQSKQSDDVSTSVPSALFRELFGRRSSETPARAHPRGEQEEVDNSEQKAREKRTKTEFSADQESDQTQASCRNSVPSETDESPEAAEVVDSGVAERNFRPVAFSKNEQEVLDALSEQPIHFDALCDRMKSEPTAILPILSMLEIDGLTKSLAGGRYARVYTAAGQGGALATAILPSNSSIVSAALDEMIAAFGDYIRTNFLRISRKYLQYYLAAHWSQIDKKRWPLGSLLRACCQSNPIGLEVILDYVSPAWVKILPAS